MQPVIWMDTYSSGCQLLHLRWRSKSKQNGENTPCSRTLTPVQKSTSPGTGQTGEVGYILEGGGHPEGR